MICVPACRPGMGAGPARWPVSGWDERRVKDGVDGSRAGIGAGLADPWRGLAARAV